MASFSISFNPFPAPLLSTFGYLPVKFRTLNHSASFLLLNERCKGSNSSTLHKEKSSFLSNKSQKHRFYSVFSKEVQEEYPRFLRLFLFLMKECPVLYRAQSWRRTKRWRAFLHLKTNSAFPKKCRREQEHVCPPYQSMESCIAYRREKGCTMYGVCAGKADTRETAARKALLPSHGERVPDTVQNEDQAKGKTAAGSLSPPVKNQERLPSVFLPWQVPPRFRNLRAENGVESGVCKRHIFS